MSGRRLGLLVFPALAALSACAITPAEGADPLDDALADFAFSHFRSSTGRTQAVRELAAAAGRRAPELLLRAWKLGLTRAAITTELAKQRGPKAVAALREILVGSAEDVGALNQDFLVHEAAKALGENRDHSGLHALIYVLEDGWGSACCWDALGRASGGSVRRPKDMPERFRNSDERGRYMATSAERWKALQRAEVWWARCRDRALRPVARAIKRLRTAAAARDDVDPWPRRRATVALYVLGAETSEKWLLSLLEDTDGFLQEFAARHLMQRGLWGFRDRAIVALNRSADAEVRARAATTLYAVLRHTGGKETLGNRYQPEALGALVAGLSDPEPMVFELCALALLPGSLPKTPGSSKGYVFNWLEHNAVRTPGRRAIVQDLASGRDVAVEAHARGKSGWMLGDLQGRRRALRRTGKPRVIATAADFLLDLAEEPAEAQIAFLRRALASPLRARVHDLRFSPSSATAKDMRVRKFVDTPRRFSLGGDWHLFTREELPVLLSHVENSTATVDPEVGPAIG
ncbi:MAG: HEAT repeat domain-containing protein, partial [Planctomycetota bacterium]